MSHNSSQFHQHAAHEPTPPIGGYRRAVRRCALTGEPLSDDTVHVPVHAPLDRQSRDHSPITPVRHPQRHRAASISTSSEPLPALHLSDLLDETLDDRFDQALANVRADAVEGQGSDE